MVKLCRQEKTPNSGTRALCQFHKQSFDIRQEEQMKGMMNLALRGIFSYLQAIFTCRKILRYGASGFISFPKEACWTRT
jgi:hypothetical protein